MTSSQASRTLASAEGFGSVVRVLQLVPDGFLVTSTDSPAVPWTVRSALPTGTTAAPGDELVVLRCQQGPVAIARVAAPQATSVLQDGTRVSVDALAGAIRVERADGTPIFHYEAAHGRGTISLAQESMEVHATGGDLRLSAAGEVRISGSAVRAEASMPGGLASVALTPRRAQLRAPELSFSATQLDVQAQQLNLRGDEVRADHKRIVAHVERLESVVDVVVSTARNVYQSVQDLLQQRAGSLRTLVTGTAHLQAREVAHRGTDSYKIRSEKIHLG